MTISREEAGRRGIRVASQFSIASCTDPTCGCSGLFIQLVDEDGAVFAIAPFGLDLVDTIVRNLLLSAQAVAQAQGGEDSSVHGPGSGAPFTKSSVH